MVDKETSQDFGIVVVMHARKNSAEFDSARSKES